MKYTEIGHPGRTANVRDVAPSAPTADAMAVALASLPRAAPPPAAGPIAATAPSPTSTPHDPQATSSTSGTGAVADKVFRSWAEDYAHNDREWRYDPDKVRRAMQIRRATRNQLHLQNQNGSAARAAFVRAAERLREKAARAPAPVDPAPAPQPLVIIKKFASPPGGTTRSGEDDAREAASRTPPVPEAAPQPDPADRAPPAIPAEPQPAAQEIPMVTYASGNKPITVPAPLDVYRHIAAVARAEDMALGQAALLLIRRAIADGGESDAHTPTEDNRQSRLIADDAATPAPLPLESIALEALLAEIRRRVENAADDEALGEAVARAEAAESQLAAIKQLLGQAS